MTREPGHPWTDEQLDAQLRQTWNESKWWGREQKLHQIVMWYAIRYLGGKKEVGTKPWKAHLHRYFTEA